MPGWSATCLPATPAWLCCCGPDGRPKLSILCLVSQQLWKLVHDGGIFLLQLGRGLSSGRQKCGNLFFNWNLKAARVSLPLTQHKAGCRLFSTFYVFWVERQNGPNCPKFPTSNRHRIKILQNATNRMQLKTTGSSPRSVPLYPAPDQ